MIADIRIDTSYRDSLSKYSDSDLASVESVEIPWETLSLSSQIARMDRFPDVKFTILVRDERMMASAADRLGRTLQLGVVCVQEGGLTLVDRKHPKWREFVQKNGPVVSRGVLLQLLKRGIKLGNHPPLALVVDDMLVGDIHVKDADVFLRLHKMRGL
jgi:hypothetical protein